jgi:CRP/FNR family transcriptional regulator, polysaccharide utilization system transcription regulator
MQFKKCEKPGCVDCEVRYRNYFNELSKDDLLELSTIKTCHLFRKGQNVYHEGASPYGLFCLNNGRIKIYINGEDGREQIIRFISPGEIFGIKSLIENQKYSTSATAIEDSIVCFINNRKLFDLIIKYPNLTNYLLVSLSRMLDMAEKRLASMALKSVRERVAESLLILHKSFNNEGESDALIKISREDLAYSVGSATETVIRMLSELKNDGLVEIKGRTVKIVNISGLIKAANIYD